MYLKLASWPEIETYLTRSKGIIIPIGSFEQHGLNGIIGTDIVCPEVIADKAVQISDVPILIGPSISVGIAQHHLGFSGSMTIRPSTLIELIKDYVNSLQVHGFNRFIFLMGTAEIFHQCKPHFLKYMLILACAILISPIFSVN